MRIWAAILLAGMAAAPLGATQPPPAGPQALPPVTPVPTRDVVGALIDALKDADYEVRYYVATALSAIGGDAVDPLIQALEDKLATTRSDFLPSRSPSRCSTSRIALPFSTSPFCTLARKARPRIKARVSARNKTLHSPRPLPCPT